MKLIKFCKPEHNIHRGAKLQVGTLFGYRNIENTLLRDEGEGKHGFTINFPDEIELDRRWCNLLLGGAVGFGGGQDTPRFNGSFSAKINTLQIVRHLVNSVVIKDTSIRIDRDVNNCLIFCMSHLENEDVNPFPEYKDSWSFPTEKTDQFSHNLGSLIFRQAKLNTFEDSMFSLLSPASAGSLQLKCTHKHVIYRNRDWDITPANKPSYEGLLDTLSNMAFVKPETYSSEKEYRFIFELHDGTRFFPTKTQSLLLNPNILIEL